LFKKLYGLDVRDLIREELRIVKEVVNLEELEKDKPKYQVFLNEASALYKNGVLRMIIDSLTYELNCEIVERANNESQLQAGRLSLIGVRLVKEEIQRLNSLWESSQKQAEQYDKHEGV